MPGRPTRHLVPAIAAAIAAATSLAASYRFALEYRRRAGFPALRPPQVTPGDVGLPCQVTTIRSPGGHLPAWFIPADHGRPGPAVVLVHGWESNRARMLPDALYLHAAGFHVLAFDVRGHGQNEPERLPISGGEFGADTVAAIRAVGARPDVTAVAVLGHSLGAVGAVLAAAAEPTVKAVVATAIPAHPRLLTRRTFELAGLRIPAAVAHPLAWLTIQVYLRPRGHNPGRVNALRAIRRYAGPILVIHGSADEVVPMRHAELLVRAAQARPGRDVELLIVRDGKHRWLYEAPVYRRRVAAFLAAHLGGPRDPGDAAARAEAVVVVRPPDTAGSLSAISAAR